MSYTVKVSQIAPTTSQDQLKDFFTFCGQITSIDFNAEKRSATIAFAKPNAAKTALMLNGGTLDGAHLDVTSDTVHNDDHANHDEHGHPIGQEDKPRAGIAAEYLAKGYVLTDDILQRAIDIDSKQGISKRFLSYFHTFDKTVGEKALGPDQTVSAKVQSTLNTATQQARSIDEQKGISKTANDYYASAISSPFGQRVFAFYTSTSKQVVDIHEEARRIADEMKAKQPSSATGTSATAASSGGPPPDPKTQAAPTVV
ncbi:hypothetical protein CPB83DRAFT_782156 [Crepidotus variabilis]|uniref:RRM domain-containing protein n=1 Tax=Crepidotus variabilis TaxID=179855 RepID=A0A9P6ER20_9AGAR|nr:hypothetical protein CPB83DRAFT_782156 [Crepidotus variabilis]